MIPRKLIIATTIGSVSLFAQLTDSTPVIETNGSAMTKSEFEQLAAAEASYVKALSEPSAKRALGSDFGKAFALEVEARRMRIEQSAAVQLKIRNFTQRLLAHELLLSLRESYLNDDAALMNHYEKNQVAFSQPRTRHILIRAKGSEIALAAGAKELTVEQARAKAEQLRKQISKGADFATLAQKESDDLGSRANGGDLGFLQRGTKAASIEAAAYKLPVGDVSVVQSEFGFHVVVVEERRSLPLAAVKAIIANELAHNKMDEIAMNGYTLNEKYFGK